MFPSLELEGKDFLIVPISRIERVFKKRALFVSPYCEREIECYWKYIPVYLPEIGILISLDTTSSDISKDLCRLVQVEREKGKYLVSKLYNFSSEYRRAVTRKQYYFVEASEIAMQNYSASVFLDLLFSPPLLTSNKKITSWIRWFRLEEESNKYTFRANYSYNVFLVFIDPVKLSNRTSSIWVGVPIQIRFLSARLAQICSDGFIKENSVYLCLEEESIDVKSSIKGYHLCIVESFNEYETNYLPAKHLSGKNLHLVRALYPVVHSPYDIMPLLFRYSNIERSDTILQFSIPLNVINRALKRLEFIEGPQSANLIEEYEKWWTGKIQIEQEKNRMIFKTIHPSVVPYLLKKTYQPLCKDFLESSKLLIEIEKNKLFEPVVAGIGRIIELKNRLWKFIGLCPESYQEASGTPHRQD